MKKTIVISFKSTRLRVDVDDFDLLNPKMKLFLRSVLDLGFYWVEKFDALKKRSKGSRRRTDPSNKYPTCLKTVRREQIVRLFAQTSLPIHCRICSTNKSMEMYVGVERALLLISSAIFLLHLLYYKYYSSHQLLNSLLIFLHYLEAMSYL